MRSSQLAVVIAVLAAACTNTDRRLERIYAEAREDLRQGALHQALEQIQDGETRAAGTVEWPWRFRLLRAEAAILQRDTQEAASLLAAEPPADRRFAVVAARRQYLLAQANILQLKLQPALSALDKARQSAAGTNDDVLMDIDALEGQALLRMRKWREAETLLQRVVEQAAAAGDEYHEAVGLLNLGMGRVVRSRFDESLSYFERLLALKQIETYTVYSAALSNAGLSYARLGQTDRAIAAQRQAVQSHEKRGLPMYLAPALGELGHTYSIHGDPKQSLSFLTRAFDVATAGKLTADAALWAGNISVAALDVGDLERAERFNLESIRLKQATKGNTIYNTLNAGLIAIGRNDLPGAERLFREVLAVPGIEAAAKWEAHAGLAKAAVAGRDAIAAASHFDDALATIQQVRSDLLRPEYRLTFLSRVIRFYQAYVGTLLESGNTARALEVADSSRGVVLAERMGGTAASHAASAAKFVAAARQARSVWLSYWLAPERSFAWVVSADGVRSVTLPGTAEIQRLVEAHRHAIEKSSTDPLAPGSPGDALAAAVLAPVMQFIPSGSSVRIVPDGALHNLNFETLPVDGPRRHYWIEDVTIAVAPSLALLAANAGRAPAAARPSLLLVGDPTPRVKEFPRLGYAPIEMQLVAAHFEPAATVRQHGDGATPAQFFAAGPERYAVIHFTAHGSANRTSPLESAVILAGPAGTDRLYARDVAERSLNAELVTISACRSAGERAYAGEGLIGFSWAFLRAGARQVIAGLWDVDDQSTARLMDALYAGIARGETAPAALRAAKLALMRQGGHVGRPYYWAPFEVFTVSP